jgi:predicted Zn-dependent peptidase
MLFQGTKTLDQMELNRRAAELGGEHNADTGYEDISLTFEVLNDDLDDALALLADQFYHTRIDPERLRKERRVVMEEIRGRLDDPSDRLYRRAWSRLFSGALAHPVAGTLSSVSQIDERIVSSFLRRHFRHSNTVLSIVGGASRAKVEKSVRRHFRHGSASPPGPVPAVRVRSGGRVRLRDENSNQAYVVQFFPVLPQPRELLATSVAIDLVGCDPDSRLFQELRERLGLTYEVGAHIEWGPDWALAVVSASGSRARIDRVLRALQDTCRGAARDGFTRDEFERARKKLRYRYAQLQDARHDQAVALAESALWGFPTPDEAERLVTRLSSAEIEAAWRRTLGSRAVTAVLA